MSTSRAGVSSFAEQSPHGGALLNGWRVYFEPASVGGRQAEEVKRRRSDGGNGAGAQRR